ncbi:MAG TPA: SAM-dependent methyltransferase [Chryseolinea sp.]|nr:SAM-dependent methyltransferase [Chryseolinea sp.]
MKYGEVYLIPNVIAEDTQHQVIPVQVRTALVKIKHFLAEDIRTARRYFSSLSLFPSIEALHFEVLNKDTDSATLNTLFAPVFEGHNLGIVSDAGCPGVADPGAAAVKFAHDHGIRVIPLVGPSSLLLALMASGLNGQRFAFHGYLPIDKGEFSKAVRELEKESRKNNQTQVFIETPYRTDATLTGILQALHNDTLLSIASDLTSEAEFILTCPVSKWKTQTRKLGKVPAVFMLLAS